MTEIETIAFDKGINRKKSPLFLSEGELYDCSGFNMHTAGQLECRNPITAQRRIDSRVGSTINGIYRYIDSIIASSKAYCPGEQAYFNYIYQRDVDDSEYSNISLMANNTRPSFLSYEKFIFCVDGESRKAFIDEKAYDWGVPNPQNPPLVSDSGVAGNPSGTYNCYVTYYIIFPNDKVVETGPSSAGSVTVSSKKIAWSQIPICPYEGENLTIYRRLWREVSGISYLVATLPENTSTTYTDNATDAALQIVSGLSTTGYSVPPDNLTDVAMHLQRVFGIKENKLYWSEPYEPFSFITTSDVTVCKDDETLLKIVPWGDQIFLVSTETWRRLQGSDPDTWSIKQTFADTGVINRDTVEVTRYGIVGLWYDGLYVFDGSMTKNITETTLGREFFLDNADWSTAYSEFDGEIYSLNYDSDDDGVLDACLKVDMTFFPELKCYFSDFVPDAHFYYRGESIDYFAYDCKEYSETGSETIVTSIQTRDFSFGNVLKQKELAYLYYDINTGGVDVTVTFYADGANIYSTTLNTSSRQRKRTDLLPNIQGYRFYLTIECEDSSDLYIYGPWALSADIFGD